MLINDKKYKEECTNENDNTKVIHEKETKYGSKEKEKG